MKNIRIETIILSIFLFQFLAGNPAFSAPPKVKWNIAESWPKDFPMFGDTVKTMIDHVNRLSNGEFKITSVPANSHKKPLGIFNFVSEGEYQMGHSVSLYWQEKDINTVFFTTIPMGMVATEQHAWFYHGGGMELMHKVYSPYGLMSFPGGNTGAQMGGWFKNEVTSVESLKGLKMRIPGLAGRVMEKLGVVPTLLPSGQLYDALKTGKIDALEFVGPSLDLRMNFHEVADYYYTGWHEPGTELQFLVNQKAFENLSPHFQDILILSMRLAAYDSYVMMYHHSAENLNTLTKKFPNIKIRAFPTSVYRALVKSTKEVMNDMYETGNPLTKEIINSLREYSPKVRLWTRFSDQAYLNNAF